MLRVLVGAVTAAVLAIAACGCVAFVYGVIALPSQGDPHRELAMLWLAVDALIVGLGMALAAAIVVVARRLAANMPAATRT